jgi:hypothetical protein
MNGGRERILRLALRIDFQPWFDSATRLWTSSKYLNSPSVFVVMVLTV